MVEEENPFLVKKKPAHGEENKPPEHLESSFMVGPEEKKREGMDQPERISETPHYEKAGTPIWDKKDVKNIHNPDYEVVDLGGGKKKEKKE